MLCKRNLDHNTNDSTNAVYVWKEIWRICGPMEDKKHWHLRWNIEIYNLYKDLNILDDVGWVGCVMRWKMEGSQK